jgi:predicted phosphodiesterase
MHELRMRIAIVSDIHGNLTALEAVLADLRETAPDMVLHGGDLADGGSSPVEIVDRVRELRWPGVVGNTDQMLFAPEKLSQFADRLPGLQALFAVVEEMATATRAALGEERLRWLHDLPRVQKCEGMALVHGKPDDAWRAPGPEASDEELESTYQCLGQPIAVYAHIHRSFVRRTARMTVANTGSVSLSYDGDPRAAYLLLDGPSAVIRRVDYDVAKEVALLSQCRLPHGDWIARTLESGLFLMP